MKSIELGRLLLNAHRKDTKYYLDVYSKNFKSISGFISSFDGLKSDISVDYSSNLDLLRYSAFANDLTTFSLKAGNSVTIQMYADPSKVPHIIGSKLSIDVSGELSKYVHSDGRLEAALGFLAGDGEEEKRFVDKLAPLILRGRVLPRPDRGVMVADRKIGQQQSWNLLGVDPNSPFDSWSTVGSESDGRAIPLRQGNIKSNEVSAFDIMFPFIGGIDIASLSKILEDEELHISNARMAVKKLVNAKEHSKVRKEELLNDVVRPELDALERRFKTISNSKALRRSGAIMSCAAVSFVGFTTGGLAAGIPAMIGAGGIGLLLDKWRTDAEEEAKVSENPYYFLWKLRQLRSLE